MLLALTETKIKLVFVALIILKEKRTLSDWQQSLVARVATGKPTRVVGAH